MRIAALALSLWAALVPLAAFAAPQNPPKLTPGTAPNAWANASIFMYHHIAVPPRDLAPADMQYFVPPATFEQQLFWLLTNGFSIVPLKSVVAALSGGPALPPKPVVITIDDGWQDFYENGLPVASKYEVPITVFVIADADKSGYMSPAERWALAHSGVDVEAHTLSHPHLTRLLPSLANAEIANSRKALEHELGQAVPLFAYPYGEFNPDVQAMVQAAGYSAAFAAGPANEEDTQQLLALPRVMVSYYDTPDSFASKARDYRWARAHAVPLPAPKLLPIPASLVEPVRLPATEANDSGDGASVAPDDMPNAPDITSAAGTDVSATPE